MMLSDYIKKEQLEQLISSWHKLKWYQKKMIRFRIFLIVFPGVAGQAIRRFVDRMHIRTVYWYPAHWIGK